MKLPGFKQGALTLATFGYGGDQTRIRKTTPDQETLYFEGLYERVTKKQASGKTEHRYYINSPERLIAIVTRGGNNPGTEYLHTDHLGSVDVVTNENGGIEERRSYDAFGQRRNPIWGQAPPASFTSKITKGFTGHEHDNEFGLVNMRGRIFDPRLGRFLTTDPIIADLYSGQSFNSFSYVFNNPLSYIDPTGFQPYAVHEPGVMVMPEDHIKGNPGGGPTTPPSTQVEGPREAVEFGAAVPATDVDTTGSWFAPDPSLPTYELPHATGPGSDDPFGIAPTALALGYERPLSLLEQFLAGEPSGGRNTFMLPYESGFFRDLGIAIASDLQIVTLRLRLTEFQPPSPREAALGRMGAAAIPMIAAALFPGAVDDLALAGATSAAKKAAHLNSSAATSRFGIYEIKINGELYKVGKADLNRVTQKSGKPTRVHSQVTKLEKIYGKGNVNEVVEDLGVVTTAEAKAAETARLRDIYNKTGKVPPGNAKSFKP